MEFQAATFQIFQRLNLNIFKNKKSQLHLLQSHIVAWKNKNVQKNYRFMFSEGSKVHVSNFFWGFCLEVHFSYGGTCKYINICKKKEKACCLIYYYFQLWSIQLHIQRNSSLPSCPSQFYLPASLRKEGRKQQGARALCAAHLPTMRKPFLLTNQCTPLPEVQCYLPLSAMCMLLC